MLLNLNRTFPDIYIRYYSDRSGLIHQTAASSQLLAHITLPVPNVSLCLPLSSLRGHLCNSHDILDIYHLCTHHNIVP